MHVRNSAVRRILETRSIREVSVACQGTLRQDENEDIQIYCLLVVFVLLGSLDCGLFVL